MNEFRLRSDGSIKNEQEIRESVNMILPTVLDSATCNLLEIDPILRSPMPLLSRQQYAKRDGVVQDVLGNWVEKYIVTDYDTDTLNSMLAKEKTDKNTYINKCRYEANFTSFPFGGKLIACDQLSRSDIESTNAQIIKHNALPTGWPGGWKAIDNEYVAIPDITTWNTFYDAMYNTGMQNFAKSQNLKLQLETATLDTINNIVW